MDQMDVSVDVMVTKVEADIIDDGIPMEDIDDMELDFFFTKCENLDLDNVKKNDGPNKTKDIIKLSDDEEIYKDVPKDVQTKEKTEKKKSVSSSIFQKTRPKLPVIKIPQSQANRRFKIAIQSNIEITNNDLCSVTPTVAYTVSTNPIVQPQSEKTKPKYIVINNKNNPKTDQTKYFKDINFINQLNNKETEGSNFPKNNRMLVSLLNQRTKPLALKPVSSLNVKPNKGLIVEKKYMQYLRKLAETPSTSKETFSEPPMSDQKNCNNSSRPDLESKNAIIKEEKTKPQDMTLEEITTKGYKVSNVGGFKAVHDASGAIIAMIEDTPDAPEESQENINFIDKKLLAVTTVQLDDWSAILSNSTRYCSLCQTLFPSRAVLDEHQAQWHPLLVPCVEEEGHYCHHCDTSFHDKTSLEKHLQTLQNTTKALTNHAFKCFICRKRFATQRAFYAHINVKHMQSLRCYCMKEFPLRELLDDHIKTVHASRPNTDTIFSEPQNREQYEVKKILDRAWTKQPESLQPNCEEPQIISKCPICGAFCKGGRKDFESHMLTHSSESPHKCDKCSYSAKISNDLMHHKRYFCRNEKDIDVPFYYCSQCGFRSGYKSGLHRHITIKHAARHS